MAKITKTYRFSAETIENVKKLKEIYQKETDTELLEYLVKEAMTKVQIELARRNKKRRCKTCKYDAICPAHRKELEADHSPELRHLCWVQKETGAAQ